MIPGQSFPAAFPLDFRGGELAMRPGLGPGWMVEEAIKVDFGVFGSR
jgi:hypothetical protein